MAKQIDINGLAEFKKKCDETYAKVGQGGTSDDIYHIIDLGNKMPWEVEDNTAVLEIMPLFSTDSFTLTKPICFKVYGNVYIPVSPNDMVSVPLTGDMGGVCIKMRTLQSEAIFILTPNSPFVIPIQFSDGKSIESLWFNEELNPPTDISKTQQLTLKNGLTRETITGLIMTNFIDAYYFNIKVLGTAVTYPLHFVMNLSGDMTFNSRISTINPQNNTIIERVYLLSFSAEKNTIEFSGKGDF